MTLECSIQSNNNCDIIFQTLLFENKGRYRISLFTIEKRHRTIFSISHICQVLLINIEICSPCILNRNKF